jgi:hypothetical protein
LDLLTVRARLDDDGAKDVEKVVKEYRRYLVLRLYVDEHKADFQNDTVPPPPRIDEVWHSHILQTRLYTEQTEVRTLAFPLPLMLGDSVLFL